MHARVQRYSRFSITSWFSIKIGKLFALQRSRTPLVEAISSIYAYVRLSSMATIWMVTTKRVSHTAYGMSLTKLGVSCNDSMFMMGLLTLRTNEAREATVKY
ncbi:hypothetical protein FRC03_006097 [Tulasnella sp. 419]|nr:hypothetical protein FRC02_007988 [Tulasnella sp. 418]KAG8960818.1 hypothetical protein FRC03_006097 [Tulasnella sp. 419]